MSFHSTWTDRETDRLCDEIADGKTFLAAAKKLGKSRGSCVGRFDRIRREMGEQAR